MININPMLINSNIEMEHSSLNAKPIGGIVYYALTAQFLTAARTAGAVTLCKTKTLDTTPE